MHDNAKNKLVAVVLLVLLLASIGTIKEAKAVTLTFIDLSDKISEAGFNPSADPFGIDCGISSDTSVYVSTDDISLDPTQGPTGAQGLLARIDKIPLSGTHVTTIFSNPDIELFSTLDKGQRFYSVARNPGTGDVFVNERDNGKLWKFNPTTQVWTPIPLIEQLTQDIVPPISPNTGGPNANPYFEYGVKSVSGSDFTFSDGYTHAPNVVRAHTTSGTDDMTIQTMGDGSVVFANGFVWVGLSYIAADENTFADGVTPILFTGIARVNPTTLEVERFSVRISESTRHRASPTVHTLGIRIRHADSWVWT